MSLKERIKIRWLRYKNKGRLPFSALTVRMFNDAVDEEVSEWINALLDTYDKSAGMELFDQVEYWSGHLDQHPNIVFDDQKEYHLFYNAVFSKYACNVITEFFRMIITAKVIDIHDRITLDPFYSIKDHAQILPPHININTRYLMEINLANRTSNIPVSTVSKYIDPLEFLYFAFPNIIDFEESRYGLVKDWYKSICQITETVIEMFLINLDEIYGPDIAVKNHALFIFTVIEFANTIFVNFYDEETKELLNVTMRSEWFAIMFGVLYYLHRANNNDILELGPLSECGSSVAIYSPEFDLNTLEYRKEMISLFIVTMSSLRARVEVDVSVKKTNASGNVANLSERRDTKDILETVSGRYNTLLAEILEQMDAYFDLFQKALQEEEK